MASTSPARITVLISGGGTNLQALIDASKTEALPGVEFVRVVSDRKDAFGLKRAEAAGIPTKYHGILPYKKKRPDSSPSPIFAEARKAYDEDLADIVLADKPEIIVCAGFMRILTPSFLQPVKDAGVPIINLHPSLYGDFVGARCIERAWEEFQLGKRKQTGIMVHYVIDEVDKGEMIVQKEVDIVGCATLDDLETRIHATEHVLIVDGTRKVVEQTRAARSA